MASFSIEVRTAEGYQLIIYSAYSAQLMSHVKLITETRVYICHKNIKSMRFFTVSRKFLRNIL